MSKTAKTVVEDVLTPARARELWTANYLPALPFTPQSFEIGALLPAMLYMVRISVIVDARFSLIVDGETV